ncbi:MAG: VWA domain-containing protein [Bacteroidia bacterium]|nr:VWA domain-containing protein [Bacteroidia bacterium]
MFRFAHHEYFYLLGIIPVYLVIYIILRIRKRKALEKMGDAVLVAKLSPHSSGIRQNIKLILFLLANAAIILSAAGPQIGSRLEEVKRKGADIIIALDVSNSMKAEDIKPSRLERAKQAISRLVDKLEGDRVGIIVFAGQAYVQLPITTDYAAAKLFLNFIDTDIIPTQGTAIGAAIELAIKSFPQDQKHNKALVIITDGENHEDDALTATKSAQEKGIIVHTFGMGSADGAPIPVYHNKVQVDYKKDRNGTIVISKLDETELSKIALEGGGKFIRATNSDDGLSVIVKEINKMEKTEFGAKMITDYEDRFQYFLGVGLLLLLLELLISERRSKFFSQFNIFDNSIFTKTKNKKAA